MARFECNKSPSLMLIGVGQFVDGSLDVDGDKAEKARRMAAVESLGIVEADGTAPIPIPAAEDSKEEDSEEFDPSEHNAKDVVEYLNGLDRSEGQAHLDEVNRVYEAEKNGDARKGILKAIEGVTTQE